MYYGRSSSARFIDRMARSSSASRILASSILSSSSDSRLRASSTFGAEYHSRILSIIALLLHSLENIGPTLVVYDREIHPHFATLPEFFLRLLQPRVRLPQLGGS